MIFFNEGKLDLDRIKEILDDNKASYNSQKIFDKEGYIQTSIDKERGILSTTYIFKNVLGQYTTIEYDEESQGLKVKRSPYTYFGQSKLLIRDDVNIMIKANYSSEECVKGKCLEFFTESGIDIEPIKFDNSVFQYIRSNYNWKKIKLQRIEREKDSTRNISYEVDPSSDKESEVDKIYNQCGIFENISFNIEFKGNIYVIKMYKIGHKITVDESQFDTKVLFEEFCLYLMNEIMSIINNELVIDSEDDINEEGVE